MACNRALQYEADQMFVEAAAEYESALEAGDIGSEHIIDLLVMYWVCTDYGFSSEHGLKPEFIIKCGSRIFQLIEIYKQKYGHDPRIEFWENYIGWSDGASQFSLEHCLSLTNDNYIEPIFYIFMTIDDRSLLPKIERLYRACALTKTTRSKYINSICDSVGSSRGIELAQPR